MPARACSSQLLIVERSVKETALARRLGVDAEWSSKSIDTSPLKFETSSNSAIASDDISDRVDAMQKDCPTLCDVVEEVRLAANQLDSAENG